MGEGIQKRVAGRLGFCESCVWGVPEVRIPHPRKELRKLLEVYTLNAVEGGNPRQGFWFKVSWCQTFLTSHKRALPSLPAICVFLCSFLSPLCSFHGWAEPVLLLTHARNIHTPAGFSCANCFRQHGVEVCPWEGTLNYILLLYFWKKWRRKCTWRGWREQ